MTSNEPYVLIVDDDKDDIMLMEEAFRRKKIKERLVSVRSGIALLEYLQINTDKRKWPRVILLDLNMPEMNGTETLSKLKEHESLKTIPIVIYSTSNNETAIRECYKLGANSYVVKPAGFENLMHTIDVIHAYWCKTASVSF